MGQETANHFKWRDREKKHRPLMCGLEVASGALAAVTDKILQTVKEWQARPLESIYPIVWLDAIHYKIRENGRVQGHAVYTWGAILKVKRRCYPLSI